MADQSIPSYQDIRYEPDERPPLSLVLGLGCQYALIYVASIVLTPAIMIRSAGGSDAYLSWAVCAALIISGVTTAIQAARIGRIGAGYILLMGTSSAFLAIGVSALEQGGPGLLASLIVIASLFQFGLAHKLALFRRIFTPVVAGTVLMLIPVTIGPLVLGKMTDVPAGVTPAAAPVTAGVTVVVLIATTLRRSGVLRLWSPVIGMGVGSVVGGVLFGLYDTTRVLEADWIGLPPVMWPGLDLSFGPDFWALLPAFVLVTLIGALDTIGDTIAIQRASWRRPRAVDFRAIQGALTADSLGNLLSGFAGTVPNTTSAIGISITTLTKVAARSVGVCVGLLFCPRRLPPERGGRRAGDPESGDGGLFDGRVGHPLRHGDAHPLSGRARLSEGHHRRPCVLDWHRVSVGLDLPGILPGGVEQIARERHDGRRLHRDPPDLVRGPDRATPPAPQDRPGRRCLSAD